MKPVLVSDFGFRIYDVVMWWPVHVLLTMFFFLFPFLAKAEESLDELQRSLSTLQSLVNDFTRLEEREEAELQLERSGELFPVPLSVEEAEREVFEERRREGISIQSEGEEITFKDVPPYSWYASYVRELAELGILSGYKDEQGRPLGEFRPGSPVSIEELAKLAVYLSGSGTSACPKVPRNPSAQGRWSTPFVACAEAWEWVVFSDATVQIDRPALRSEVVVTVLQAFATPFGGGRGEVFTDVGAGTQFAGAIERAATDGIIAGYRDAGGNSLGLFGPDDPITRAQLTKVLVLAMKVYGY